MQALLRQLQRNVVDMLRGVGENDRPYLRAQLPLTNANRALLDRLSFGRDPCVSR